MLMIKWLGLSVGVDVLHTIVPLRLPILSHDLIHRVAGACKKIYMVFLESIMGHPIQGHAYYGEGREIYSGPWL